MFSWRYDTLRDPTLGERMSQVLVSSRSGGGVKPGSFKKILLTPRFTCRLIDFMSSGSSAPNAQITLVVSPWKKGNYLLNHDDRPSCYTRLSQLPSSFRLFLICLAEVQHSVPLESLTYREFKVLFCVAGVPWSGEANHGVSIVLVAAFHHHVLRMVHHGRCRVMGVTVL